MTTHIGARLGEIAPTILLPGDPLRAKFFAETLLEDVVQFNRVRGMLGFTGRYGDKPISVMGTGMGMPSISIYVNELINEFGVTTLMRVGTCGALQPDLKLGDVVLAQAASTNSQMNKRIFGGMDYAPAANFALLSRAHAAATAQGVSVQVGGMLSTDAFYEDDPDWWKIWAQYGALVAEMETAALYTLAAKYGVDALAILTVCDSLVTGESASAETRERGYVQMAQIALAAAP